MKQLKLKLTETESQNQELSSELKKLQREMKGSEDMISRGVQNKLETLFVDLSNEIISVFGQYQALNKKHDLSQIEVLEKQDGVRTDLAAIFKLIRRERVFEQLD